MLTRSSAQDALVNTKIFGLNTVTLRRDTSPGKIDSGEKLLFTSAGKDRSCAFAVCPGNTVEKINPPIMSRAKIDLFIFHSSKRWRFP
jgi:hypothetical protein